MGRRADGGAGRWQAILVAMTRYLRTVAWTVVALLVLALAASLVLEGR
jgi:hypothetical protein